MPCLGGGGVARGSPRRPSDQRCACWRHRIYQGFL